MEGWSYLGKSQTLQPKAKRSLTLFLRVAVTATSPPIQAPTRAPLEAATVVSCVMLTLALVSPLPVLPSGL